MYNMKINNNTLGNNITFDTSQKNYIILNDKHLRIFPFNYSFGFSLDNFIKKYDKLYDTESTVTILNIPVIFLKKFFEIDEYGFITDDDIKSIKNVYDLTKKINDPDSIFKNTSNIEQTSFLIPSRKKNNEENIEIIEDNNVEIKGFLNEKELYEDIIDIDYYFPDIKLEVVKIQLIIHFLLKKRMTKN